jgi:hypothetical protein
MKIGYKFQSHNLKRWNRFRDLAVDCRKTLRLIFMKVWTGLNWRYPLYTGFDQLSNYQLLQNSSAPRFVTCSLTFCAKISNSIYFPSLKYVVYQNLCWQQHSRGFNQLSKKLKLSRKKNDKWLSVKMGSDLMLISKYGRITKYMMLLK